MATTTIESSLDITLMSTPFTLMGTYTSGQAGAGGFVGGFGILQDDKTYAPYALKDAPSLNGKLDDLVKEIKNVINPGDDFDPVGFIKGIAQSDGVLTNLINEITSVNVRITMLSIDTANKLYGFGFALDFTANPVAFAGITISSFGFVYTHKP